MKITINALEENERVVCVKFEYNDVTHERNVNAVFTDGVYDEEATAKRVEQVAAGVKIKIDSGIIQNVEEVIAPEEVVDPEESLIEENLEIPTTE